MDVRDLQRLDRDLDLFLAEFDHCFAKGTDSARHLATYVRGQISSLDAKSVEPIALAAGTPVRTLQQFLTSYRWDEDAARRGVAAIVVRDHAGPDSIAIIDETSDVKKGEKTPGVQRQWCGKAGKTENCITAVHLAYAQSDFHALLDGELFLPESWSNDRQRCREAGVPDEMVHRPKWQIAWELFDRAVGHGVAFHWLTADEGYGGKPGFLDAAQARGVKYVVEVPRNASVFPRWPKIASRAARSARVSPRPRVASGERKARSVERHFWFDPEGKSAPKEKYLVKETDKGPAAWEALRTRVVTRRTDGLPGHEAWLIVCRNLLDPGEIKYFLSNALDEPIERLLLVAFSRWRVEQAFHDQKQEVGLDCWEGRKYLGFKRHLIATSLSYLFLAKSRQRLREKKSRDHGSTAAPGDQRPRSMPVRGDQGKGPPPATGTPREKAGLLAAEKRRRPGITRETGAGDADRARRRPR